MFDVSDVIFNLLDKDLFVTYRGENVDVEEFHKKLNEPCNMKNILLKSGIMRYRVFNTENLTNYEVIEMIHTFYKHKTFRRCIEDKPWFQYIFQQEPEPNQNVFRAISYNT